MFTVFVWGSHTPFDPAFVWEQLDRLLGQKLPGVLVLHAARLGVGPDRFAGCWAKMRGGEACIERDLARAVELADGLVVFTEPHPWTWPDSLERLPVPAAEAKGIPIRVVQLPSGEKPKGTPRPAGYVWELFPLAQE